MSFGDMYTVKESNDPNTNKVIGHIRDLQKKLGLKEDPLYGMVGNNLINFLKKQPPQSKEFLNRIDSFIRRETEMIDTRKTANPTEKTRERLGLIDYAVIQPLDPNIFSQTDPNNRRTVILEALKSIKGDWAKWGSSPLYGGKRKTHKRKHRRSKRKSHKKTYKRSHRK
jgi:hypothetical protein